MKFSTFFTILCSFFFIGSLQAQPGSADKKVFLTNEATINSDKLEYSPAFLEDGIVFISTKPFSRKYKVRDKRINQNIMSIYRAQRQDNGLLRKPEPFALELLSTVHEGPLTFDRTANNIFFTRNNLKKGKKKRAKDGIVKLKIYTAERIDSTWKNVEELPFNDDESNTCHPAISVDGDALYFASDRPGGFGGMDIWVAYRRGGLWSAPENLGATINTEGDEVFPFIHADGSIYFASTGHAGYGGMDLFSAQNLGGTWDSPENLGTPFNSEQDDFGFIIDRDKKNGYFSSSREGGLGGDDIYSFYVYDGLDRLLGTEPATNLEPRKLIFLVSDLSTGSMIDSAQLTYADLNNLALSNAINAITEESNNNSEILLRLPLEGNSKNGLTDSFGKFPVNLVPGSYVFLIEKPGFESQQIVVNTANETGEIFVSLSPVDPNANNDMADGSNPSDGTNGTSEADGTTDGENEDFGSDAGSITDGEVTFPSTIKEGTVFQLPNIYYNFNDASIRPDARIDLDALAAFLVKYPDIEIELSSHTDSRGENRYNRKLSQRRAENSVDYLASRGVERNRMTAVGYGEDQLRNNCGDDVDCSELEHQYNRRTEVKITSMNQEINIKFVRDDSMPDIPASSESSTASSPTSDNEEATPSPSPVTSNADGGEFKVIAGVFRDYSNAESRLNKLQSLGYNAELISVGDEATYSVVVGRFGEFANARELVQELKNDHYIRSFIKR